MTGDRTGNTSIQRVLITGAGGFIGSHLSEACVAAGFKVRALIRYNSRGSRGWLEGLDCERHLEVIAGDVCDPDIVSHAVRGVDTVFHLAALIGIPYSYESPRAYVKTNVEGTANVLMAAREHGVDNVVLTSTSETYGSAQSVPMGESHPSVAQSPYAATKIAADHLGLSFARSFDLGVKIVRPFNTYGPRQSLRAIVPTIISQLLSGAEVSVGNTHPTRDLTFVTDTVAGFLAVARSNQLSGTAVNVGMGQEISVGSLIGLIARLMGIRARVATSSERQRPQTSEVDRLLCDNTRLVAATGWSPVHTLESGLAETIEWFRRRGPIALAGSYHV